MMRVLSLLTGLALLSQENHAVAQAEAAKSKGLEQLFSTIVRAAIGGKASSARPAADGKTVVTRQVTKGETGVGQQVAAGKAGVIQQGTADDTTVTRQVTAGKAGVIPSADSGKVVLWPAAGNASSSAGTGMMQTAGAKKAEAATAGTAEGMTSAGKTTAGATNEVRSMNEARSANSEGGEHQVLLKASCEKIMKEGTRMIWLNDRSGRMRLQLRSIYTQGATLYFMLRLNNRSPLDYDVAGFRFLIADPAKGKKPMVILGEVQPVYVYNSSAVIRGYSRATNVIVLPRFTLPQGKRLLIEVLEKNGGRHLRVETSNFTLERAHIL